MNADALYFYKATVTDVYDGDTVTADLDLGLGVVMRKQKLRLYGINTPELRGAEAEDGKRSRQALMDFIEFAGEPIEIVVRTYKDKTGKFGRWLVELFADGENVNDVMVDYGFAQRNYY